jgi:hypothetical protein
MTDWLDQIDFCIKTYKRPKALARLRASIERFYPGAHITVNGQPDICEGRNALARDTQRPFLLFLDDDFEFTNSTTVLGLLAQIRTGPQMIDICGGGVEDVTPGGNVLRNSGGNFRLENRTLYLECCEKDDPGFRGFVQMVPNFFIARRGVFDKVRWRFGLGAEHADFFMQADAEGLLTYQDRRFTILHYLNSPCDPGYKAARWDVGGPILAFMDHWGVDRIVVNGKVVQTRPMEAVR